LHRLWSPISLLVLSVLACQHQTEKLSPPLRATAEDNCWWAVTRSPLPLDSVVARFAGAFRTVGLGAVSTKRIADSAWVHGGPTVIPEMGGATYESRVVGYWDGSSTHFRQFVSLVQNRSDSVNAGQRTIPFCATTARGADVRAIVPQTPTGEEGLKLWTRAP
jgi:hypothetical protein